jgi:hypothetical protein
VRIVLVQQHQGGFFGFSPNLCIPQVLVSHSLSIGKDSSSLQSINLDVTVIYFDLVRKLNYDIFVKSYNTTINLFS